MNVDAQPCRRRRLKGWDYSHNGAYFLTFCTADRLPVLGKIELIGSGSSEYALFEPSTLGEACIDAIERLKEGDESFHIDSSVVMPNHVHLLVFVHRDEGAAKKESSRNNKIIQRVVARIKSHVTRIGRQELGIDRVWQVSFHDHIIRDGEDLERIREYIENNPLKWMLDRYYQQ